MTRSGSRSGVVAVGDPRGRELLVRQIAPATQAQVEGSTLQPVVGLDGGLEATARLVRSTAVQEVGEGVETGRDAGGEGLGAQTQGVETARLDIEAVLDVHGGIVGDLIEGPLLDALDVDARDAAAGGAAGGPAGEGEGGADVALATHVQGVLHGLVAAAAHHARFDVSVCQTRVRAHPELEEPRRRPGGDVAGQEAENADFDALAVFHDDPVLDKVRNDGEVL